MQVLLFACLKRCYLLPLFCRTYDFCLWQTDFFALRQLFLDRFGLSNLAIYNSEKLDASGIAR